MLEQHLINYLVSSGSETFVLLGGLFVLYRQLFKIQNENQRQIAEKVESVATRANGFFDVFLDSFDFPAWVKRVVVKDSGEVEFRTHFVNRAFEDILEKTRVQCIGRTDEQIWSKLTAIELHKKDLEVLKKRNPIFSIDSFDDVKTLQSKRFYVYYRGDHWIVGFAPPLEEHKHG